MKLLTSLTLLTLLMVSLLFSSALAEDVDSSSITINDLAWMTGRWIGPGFGGICEEVWNEPLGGSLTGSFKLVVDDQVVFYEIMTLTISEGQPTLRLKHFNADLTGWEEKDEVISFAFDQLNGQSLQFHGLSYVQSHPDSLIITVGTENSSGDAQLIVINCHLEN